ncbi:matrix-remodeling-associated protein 5 [Trichomycterus rosablanca]|uniref:matrix-remodeling-associated protein 5 n=1 Tax=Trichomycterus rosablanca TaxID=2290929 RepID=UPI002F34EF99
MASLGVSAPWRKAVLYLLLAFLPACLCACPRSCSCPNPKEVHCTFRHLSSTPRNIPKDTERVNLGYNSIEAVGTTDFANLRQLEMLMLHGNDIGSVASGSFYHLRSLQILKLSYNKIKSVDSGTFEGLTGLVRLHLDHNQIDFINPFSFNGLTSLKLLQLEGNRLRDLHPHAFTTISLLGAFWGSGLRHLYLADNRLEYLLPGTLQHLSRLEVLSLHGNPWTCDCHLGWLVEWDKKHEGVIKCKKDRDSVASESCAVCASPQTLNNSQIFQLSAQQLSCDRPSLQSPLKLGENSVFEDQEPDLPYTKDLERPLGDLALMLSDSHGNRAHVACDVNRPGEGTSVAWDKLKNSEEVAVNVTLQTQLECEIDRDTLQNLWRLVAYYYESPAVLERGSKHENTSKVTYQYAQVTTEDSPYFTELKGHLEANPAWLLQPKVTIQLNRRKTTSKKLVMNFSTFISKRMSGRGEQDDPVPSWALIPRGNPGRVQIVLEHSKIIFDCDVLTSGDQSVEWMLPDLTILDKTDSQRIVSEHNRLIIENASLSDGGLYHCFVRTEVEVEIVSYRLVVRECLLSPGGLNGKRMSVENEESLRLPCSVTSPHPVETGWFLPNNQILQASNAKGRIYVSPNNTLIITNVLDEDAGEYSCLAANLNGADMLSHQVVVVGKKRDEPQDVTVVKGQLESFDSEDAEGSGYQEIKRFTATHTSQRGVERHRGSGRPHRPGFKGKKIKENARKGNKSVKEVDPGRWAQLLAKARAKASTVPPITISAVQTTPAPTTPASTTSVDPTTSSATTSTSMKVYNTKPLSQPPLREPKDGHLHKKTDDSHVPTLTSLNLHSTTSPPSPTLSRKESKNHLERPVLAGRNRLTKNHNRFPNQGHRPFNRNRSPFRRPRPTRPPKTTTEAAFAPSTSAAEPESTTLKHVPFQATNKTPKRKHFTNTNGKLGVRQKSSQVDRKTGSGKQAPVIGFADRSKYQEFDEALSTTPYTPVVLPTTDSKWYGHKSIEDEDTQELRSTSSSENEPPITEKPLTTDKPVINNNRPKLDNSGVIPGRSNVPVHPWLTQRRKQISATSVPYTSSPFYTNRIPVWPRVHESKHHSLPDRTKQTSERHAGFTNRPQIIVQTANPTPDILLSAPTDLPKTTPPQMTPPSRARDYLLFNRLRNRYRQSQIDAQRLAQLGKLVTPKPRTQQPTPRPHPAPNVPNVYKPVTPPSVIAATSKPHSTASILQGSRWHYGQSGDRTKIQSTALPFPNLMGSGVKPRIMTTESDTVSALAETNVLLRCQASGDPKPAISWTKVSTGATIQAGTKHGQRFEVFPNGTFFIKNVQLQDRGQYLCAAQNKFGSDRTVINLAVQTEPPRIQGPKFRDVSVYLGKVISLDCVASGKPQAQVSWILPNRTFVREVMPVDRPVSLFPNGTLRIQSANFSNKGNYKCIANNAAGADTLTYYLHVAALPPTINEDASESIPIHTGRNMYVHCTAKGEPEPLLRWLLPDGTQLKPTQFIGRRLFVFPNGTLYIKTILPTDAGKYECSATNVVGLAQRVVKLDIRQESVGPWKGPSEKHSVSAMYGSTVFLHCPESVDSQRGTVWRLPTKTLLDHRYSPLRHIAAFPNGTLRILQLTEKDGGSYLCMYQKPNGEDMELFQLDVLMKPPKIENMGSQQKRVTNGENFVVDCVASGLPDPEVTWSLPDGTMINNALQSDDSGGRSRRYVIFENGTLLMQQMGKSDEGDYTCYAKNTLGEDAMKVSVQVVPNSPRIAYKDQTTLRVSLGQSAQIKCDATGEPAPTIIWISPKNEMIVSSSLKYETLNDGTLIIHKVTLADQGKYTCVARNLAGDDIKNVKLQVDVREPHINGKKGQTHSRILVVSYQAVLLHCEAEAVPDPLITWTTPYGMTLPKPYTGGRFQVHKNGTLEIRGIRKTDEGRFSCVAKNGLGEASLAVDLEVASLAEKPSFILPNIEVLSLKPDGEDITLNCQAIGKPKPDFVWILPNNTALAPGMKLQRFVHSPENGTLHILKPVLGDKGVYRCLAKNIAGQAEKRYALEPGRRPQIREKTAAPLKISFGRTVNMPCSVEGWPQVVISWTLPNGLVLDRPQVIGRVTFLSNGTLQLKETAKSDRGTYVCKATNTFGSSTLSYPVTIMVFPPQITSAPPSITKVAKGSPVTLRCIASGIPKPDISWTLPGRTTLVPNNRYTMSGIYMTEEGSLVIQDPSLMHSGIYKCNAKNALGMDFKATYLQVN